MRKSVETMSNLQNIQWGESSPAKHGGAYFSAVVGPRILAITGEAIEKPYALHNSLGIHLARTFGATGKEQPSPPLHLAAAARLLSCRALRWCSCMYLSGSTRQYFPIFGKSYFLFAPPVEGPIDRGAAKF